MKVFSTGPPNCRWSTRLATPLGMLSRKSLTNNGTTQRSKQAVAGQAREVAGAGCWLDSGHAAGAPGLRLALALALALARRPAPPREVGRRVPSFCRLSGGRLRWMFRPIAKSPGRWGPQQKRAPEKPPTFPTGGQWTRSRSVLAAPASDLGSSPRSSHQ